MKGATNAWVSRERSLRSTLWSRRAKVGALARGLRGVEGLGLGDVKLAAVAGVWLDWADLPAAVELAAVAALATVLYRRWRGEDLGMQARLPFGAFLAPAIWLCWLVAAWRGETALAVGLVSTGP